MHKTSKISADAGDILMARVGKGCVGRIGRVNKGSILLTDCVYRIRVANDYQDIVWNSLKSEDGQKWLDANIHGVCSKVIRCHAQRVISDK
ncbi:hypothetical protein KHS38_12900 [Mucilaginibacter sp. Bleaf8]|uniref:hypothetical protein n=1 Tax=Mucilaginibacter sp. Bleaf8 TaxID=2834430 RepID=UPI001BD18B8F|nr:hypothetical protein [Mucilaginibacter sp. Bleaf8]MBS7565304.1 hypothetical protein [Mucilaginibacter sp. Bleaf8]